jgi:hypothetical protein
MSRKNRNIRKKLPEDNSDDEVAGMQSVGKPNAAEQEHSRSTRTIAGAIPFLSFSDEIEEEVTF